MRSPIIAFSIVAAAAVSPTLVSGAPTSPNLPTGNLPGNGVGHGLPSPPVGAPGGLPAAAALRRDLETRSGEHLKKTHRHKHYARQNSDGRTAGGNAYSGSSSNVDGGDVFNVADTPNGVITNNPGSNTAGIGGDTFTGDAVGGNGGGFGPGGNGYSGFSGNSDGGDVDNVGTSNIDNIAVSNTAGDAGTTTSGDAIGGDEDNFNFDDFDNFEKRDIDNDGGLAGDGGFSTSGLAEGGRGGDDGQGGNAYSGSVGHANGGDVNNGEIDVEEFQPTRGPGYGPGFGSAAGTGVPGAPPAPPPPPPNTPPTRFGGGNAYSGNTGNDRGGNFNNVAEDDQDIANVPGGTAGGGGQSFSGDAIGGDAA
ncbi:hypothetical protein EIP91_012279 [Steccherinum ochraceum]|uniref:Uncharacterized protein n=1 Tax=Steccherinum ochraceum TaxID=92696 RepID=A0A4R0RNC9_9APHY|nr:hypothetical protein EIP91_012279 [Steccherinum ochraceum]